MCSVVPYENKRLVFLIHDFTVTFVQKYFHLVSIPQGLSLSLVFPSVCTACLWLVVFPDATLWWSVSFVIYREGTLLTDLGWREGAIDNFRSKTHNPRVCVSGWRSVLKLVFSGQISKVFTAWNWPWWEIYVTEIYKHSANILFCFVFLESCIALLTHRWK